ncbi:MAG: thiamine diphosphokinase [Lachnospiraceae bacterium]|nr:thiamine diphosphokinase [Lachnospiraceae bacterium]
MSHTEKTENRSTAVPQAPRGQACAAGGCSPRWLILLGGDLDENFLCGLLVRRSFDRIVLTDGAIRHAGPCGITPTDLVGDFDTASRAAAEHLAQACRARLHLVSPIKDDTDSELAVRLAVSEGAGSITVTGALGGRADHALANILLLQIPFAAGIPAEILEEKNRITLLEGERSFRREDHEGEYLSFFPLHGSACGVTLRGFKYPLEEADLSPERPTLCVSNEITAPEAYCRVRDGVLICMETRD